MKAGIIGATGYAGAELVRLLAGHPHIEELFLSSTTYEGERIENVYPNFLKKVSAPLKDADEVVAAADVVFASLPHGVGEPFAKACVEKGKPFIDLSADFRFGTDEATFSAWYDKPYQYPELRRHSVYGLPELNRQSIKNAAARGAVIVGNPGCYPTGATLGIAPALERGMVNEGTDAFPLPIIIDAASGITGGGRNLSRPYHYPECADSLSPYKVGCHRHTPEISRNLATIAKRDVPLIFTPHLAPMNRGILSSIYLPLAKAARPSGAPRPPSEEVLQRADAIRALYTEYYKDEFFLRVVPLNSVASTGRVRQSNFCDISIHLDQSGSTLIVISAIDNMVKGAAGQAVQNMNIIAGFDESAGLTAAPALF
jgi:N-acetyl-gamma-glutamyl-phosphate reductase